MYWLNTLISGSVLNSGSVIDSEVVLNNGNRPQSSLFFRDANFRYLVNFRDLVHLPSVIPFFS